VSEEREAWVLAGPGLLLLSLFLAIPAGFALLLSFTDLRLGSPFPAQWVGLRQYVQLAHDPSVRAALVNNLLFASLVVPLQTGLALAVACALSGPGTRLYRSLFLFPVALPVALVAVVWEPFLGDRLHDPAQALLCLVAISLWQGLGLQMVILLAGVQAIPESHYETARLEGASAWQTFRFVTLPGLRNPLTFTALLTLVLAFRVFDQVQVLTRGGPGDQTSTVVFLLVRTAFERLQVGRASAMACVFLAVVVGLTLLQRALCREEKA